MPISITPVSDSVTTLKTALRAYPYKWSGNSTETQTRLTVELGDGPEIYQVIRAVLHAHGVKGAGLCGGPLEIYPLQDGTTFCVDWGTVDTDEPAVLTIVRMAKAY